MHVDRGGRKPLAISGSGMDLAYAFILLFHLVVNVSHGLVFPLLTRRAPVAWG